VQHLSGSDPMAPSDDTVALLGAAGEPSTASDPAAHASAAAMLEQTTLLTELARLLVEPGEREALLARALELGAHLVPAVERWQVFIADQNQPGALFLVIERGGESAKAETSSSSLRRVATLGLGATVDKQVLEQHRRVVLKPSGHARPGRRNGEPRDGESKRGAGICVPLVGFDGQPGGALVGRARAGVALSAVDVRMLETVAYHVTAIVVQRARPEARAAQQDGEQDPRVAFISLAAHELRSPLTSVKGYAQLLLRAARKSPMYSENHLHALQSIEQQAARMSDMVGELLDAARIQRGALELQPRVVDLEGLVRRVVEQRRQGLERHELHLDTDTVTLVGRWDPQRLEQVIRDLIDNAIRYSPDGGVVGVRVSHSGHDACVCVRDEGIGVPLEERDHIFEAFYRGEEPRRRNLSGLGLGLFVSRAIIDRLGGRIWLDLPEAGDVERRGSWFCIALPLAGAELGSSN
jgi:signal transduction histidine kinase